MITRFGQIFEAAIFDLDGVLVDTAKYHYLAWKKLAESLGFEFSAKDNERLKGVSRMRSLEILLEVGCVEVADADKEMLAERKNNWYVAMISKLDEAAFLPGASACLRALHQENVPMALASASKNAGLLLARLQIAHLFRYIVDAKTVARAKPDPEVFLRAAEGMGIDPAAAVVFEDAAAGIEAAHAAGMYAVGIGDPDVLASADKVTPDLAHLDVLALFHKR
jgi:beta-phosphoglucomutase